MLDGQHQGVDIPAHAKTTYNSRLQKKKDWKKISAESSVMSRSLPMLELLTTTSCKNRLEEDLC